MRSPKDEIIMINYNATLTHIYSVINISLIWSVDIVGKAGLEGAEIANILATALNACGAWSYAELVLYH